MCDLTRENSRITPSTLECKISPAGVSVIPCARRSKIGARSSCSSLAIWRLIADGETCSRSDAALIERVCAVSLKYRSAVKSMVGLQTKSGALHFRQRDGVDIDMASSQIWGQSCHLRLSTRSNGDRLWHSCRYCPMWA